MNSKRSENPTSPIAAKPDVGDFGEVEVPSPQARVAFTRGVKLMEAGDLDGALEIFRCVLRDVFDATPPGSVRLRGAATARALRVVRKK